MYREIENSLVDGTWYKYLVFLFYSFFYFIGGCRMYHRTMYIMKM